MPVIVTGTKDIKYKLRAMRKRASNPNPAWPRVGAVINKAVAEQFATKGAHFGTPWRPLRPKYLAWKLSHGYPRDILVMTGEMRGTFLSRPMDYEDYRGQKAVFGSTNQKAVWHHHGTRYRGQQINPPRPILKATKPLAEDVAVVLGNYIAGYNRRRIL